MIFELNAQTRNLQGTGASRRLRRAGKVPAVVYGGTEKAQAIELDHNDLLLKLRKEAFQSSIIHLNIDGTKQAALLRDVQAHAYKPQVLHVDFQRVDDTHEVHQRIPLHFLNADIAPGVKLEGGIVSHVLTELEIVCLAKHLPEFIEVDLSALATGHSVHVADIKLPEGVKVASADQNPVVATILAIRRADDAATADTPAA